MSQTHTNKILKKKSGPNFSPRALASSQRTLQGLGAAQRSRAASGLRLPASGFLLPASGFWLPLRPWGSICCLPRCCALASGPVLLCWALAWNSSPFSARSPPLTLHRIVCLPVLCLPPGSLPLPLYLLRQPCQLLAPPSSPFLGSFVYSLSAFRTHLHLQDAPEHFRCPRSAPPINLSTIHGPVSFSPGF